MAKKLTHEEFMVRVIETNKYVRNGEIEILGEYNGMEQKIQYLCHKCNTVQNPVAASLLNGCGCKECGKTQSGMSNRKSHQKFVEELRQINDTIVVLGRYTTNRDKIDFMCEHGHVWSAAPAHLLRGEGCPYCSSKRVLVGYNDIATTSPDILGFLADPNDGYKYTRWSNKRVDFKCPLCGLTQNRKIASLAHRGFKCEYCGNGLSYPNKFGRAFFDQLPVVEYRAEYCPDWGKPYVYDIYFRLGNQEYVVEWDGIQHFETRSVFHTTLAERQAVDNIKNKLANDNGVTIIRVNCAKSECEYIKNNIEQSVLGSLFDLSQIDWQLCDERAQKNLVKFVCDLWMSGIHSFDELSSMLHLGNSTVRDYINKGTRLGWCDYDPKWWIPGHCRPISVTDMNSGKEYIFDSLQLCSVGTIDLCGQQIAPATIKKYCQNGLVYRGLLFKDMKSTIQN